jgi:hypothetical protein
MSACVYYEGNTGWVISTYRCFNPNNPAAQKQPDGRTYHESEKYYSARCNQKDGDGCPFLTMSNTRQNFGGNFCNKCGSQYTPGSNFCSNCGTRL